MRQSLIESIILEDKQYKSVTREALDIIDDVVLDIISSHDEVMSISEAGMGYEVDLSGNSKQFLKETVDEIIDKLDDLSYHARTSTGRTIYVEGPDASVPYIEILLEEIEWDDDDIRSMDDFRFSGPNEEYDEYVAWLSSNNLEDTDDNYYDFFRLNATPSIYVEVVLVG